MAFKRGNTTSAESASFLGGVGGNIAPPEIVLSRLWPHFRLR